MGLFGWIAVAVVALGIVWASSADRRIAAVRRWSKKEPPAR